MATKNFLSYLTVENGMVKLYHYSSTKINNGIISVNKPYGLQSKNEFRAWGKSRSFFYANEDGYKWDKGISTNYLYICYIPINDIYPINENPYKYEKNEGDLNIFDSFFKQSWEDGFTAWGYFLDNNKKAPIIISFIDIPISESYKISKGGLRVPIDSDELDFRIGSILIGNEKYFVMQKSGYPLSLLNCYLTDEKNPKKAMKGYQKTLEVFMWDDLNIDKQFIQDYVKDLKKSKIWRKRLSESVKDKLKSKTNSIEQQKEEYIKQLIDKGIENLNNNEIEILLQMGKSDLIFNKVLEDVKVFLNYWDKENLKISIPALLFTLGKTKIVLSFNKTFFWFDIQRYIVDKKWGYKKFGRTYPEMLKELTELLKEGDITNE